MAANPAPFPALTIDQELGKEELGLRRTPRRNHERCVVMLNVSFTCRGALTTARCLTLLLALNTGCGEPPPDKPPTLSFVHLEDGRLVDASNRHLLLRGINARIEGTTLEFSDPRIMEAPLIYMTGNDAV